MSEALGKAYVQIVPSAEGITSALEEVLGGPLKTAGKKLGPSLGATIGSGLKTVGSGMTNYITKPALAAAAALGGATLFSGWKRMTEIDNAKVKLEAIGNSAKEVKAITQNALDSVKGTAYGMNEAMTTSASAVAAGIKPGKTLTHYLSAISDAAAVAGTDMASMGSIFNKVATSGKAQNDVLGQMADAGIPIYQYLADQMGVTADAVFDMASAGEVGLADFQAAVSSHIGGAAKEIGSKTIIGAISNLKASISRIGANFLGSADDADSFAGKILPMLNTLIENLGPIEDKAKEFGSKFADGFQKFADVIGSIPLPVLAGIGGALVSIGPALKIIGTIMTAVGPVTTALTTLLGGPLAGAIMGAVAPIMAIAAGLALMYARSETFRNAVNGLILQVATAVMPILQTVGAFLSMLVGEVMSVAQAIGNTLAPVMQLLTPVIVFIANLIGIKLKLAFVVAGAVIRTVANAIKAAAAIIQGFAQALAPLVPKVTAVFNAVKAAITNPVKTASSVIKSIVDKIKGFFSFSIKAPNIPLPHFSVKPSGWKVGDLLKGTIPSLSISWHAKGGIVDKATLIGAGEAGPEAIVPLDPFWEKLDKREGSIDYEKFAATILDAFRRANLTVETVVDGKVIARSTAPYMKREINNLEARANRAMGIVGV